MNVKHNKEDILLSGQKLFRAQGYHATGIQEILKEAKISKGSFYNYFKSKEDFAVQVVDLYGNYMTEYIIGYTNNTELSPVNRLKKLYASLIAIAAEEECSKGCLVYNFSYEVAGHNETLRKATNQHFDTWVDLIEDCIKSAQDVGEIRTDMTARELAAFLHTTFNGSFGDVKMKHSVLPMEQILQTSFDLIKT